MITGILLYTAVAGIFAYYLVYASLSIRRHDRSWLSDRNGKFRIWLCIAIAFLWPMTVVVSAAVLLAETLFNKKE